MFTYISKYYFEIGFYRNLTNEESEQAKRGKFNFDHPGNYLVVTYLFLTLIYVAIHIGLNSVLT